MKGFVRAQLAALSRRAPPFRGKMRLTRALDRALAGTAPVPAHSFGASFVVEGRDLIEFSILWHGAYGRHVIECLQREITERGRTCFWDVGANIGCVSLPLAMNNPRLDVHCFEPSPRVLAKLVTNVMANPSLSNVRVYSVALSTESRLVPFFESGLDVNSGVGGMMPLGNRRGGTTLVHGVRGDELIAEHGVAEPDLIKIDTEGWEPEVIGGLRHRLESAEPLSILWEHVPSYFRLREQALDTVTGRLRECGFELFACRPGGVFEPLRPAILSQDNDLFARRG